jgi:predicted ester cyclase
MLQAMPDLHIDIRRRHAGEDAIIVEVVIRGRHLGTWRGLHATGRQMEFPLCGVFTFDEGNRLAGEKIYYDRATPLEQVGVFHDPESLRGRITTALTHPVTMARIVARKALRL